MERSIDLSFVRELATEFYSSVGRPSIDPVVTEILECGLQRYQSFHSDGQQAANPAVCPILPQVDQMNLFKIVRRSNFPDEKIILLR